MVIAISGSPTSFRSFVLRFWQENEGEWRIRLESVPTGPEAHYFSELESLLAFLKSTLQTGLKNRDPPDNPSG